MITRLFDDIKDIAYRIEHRKEVTATYTKTGLKALDRMTNGMKPGNLIVVAARPSMGKTALALNIATNVAFAGKPVLFFTLEMTKEEVQDRILYSEALLDGLKAERGDITEQEWTRIHKVFDKFNSSADLFICDKGSLSPSVIEEATLEVVKDVNLGLIVVDYIQIMGSEGAKSFGTREQEVAHASRTLKALAKAAGCPLMALSQLNRSVDHRSDKRPNMSDLRESGAIEQDADGVWLLYRDDYYKNMDEQPTGIAECLIAKQRNGPTGCVELRFIEESTRFEDV